MSPSGLNKKEWKKKVRQRETVRQTNGQTEIGISTEWFKQKGVEEKSEAEGDGKTDKQTDRN